MSASPLQTSTKHPFLKMKMTSLTQFPKVSPQQPQQPIRSRARSPVTPAQMWSRPRWADVLKISPRRRPTRPPLMSWTQLCWGTRVPTLYLQNKTNSLLILFELLTHFNRHIFFSLCWPLQCLRKCITALLHTVMNSPCWHMVLSAQHVNNETNTWSCKISHCSCTIWRDSEAQQTQLLCARKLMFCCSSYYLNKKGLCF